VSFNDIADLSGVSPQCTFLESKPEEPDPKSTLYIRRFTTTNADKSQDHTVVGVHIVLAKGNPNQLWETFHVDRGHKLDPLNPHVATRKLEICCDTLEIYGELSIPEAQVSIYARRLVWATADASITTTPLDWAVDKAADAAQGKPGKNGVEGRNAGDLQVFVGAVEPADDARPRFIANGGRGQHPGRGLDGSRGKNMTSYSSVSFTLRDSKISESKATVNFSPAAVYIDYEWRWAVAQWASGKKGEDAFPGNGGDALAPGIPGNGGHGGKFTTNVVQLAKSLRNTGGQAGTKERDYSGGAAGTPTKAGKYRLTLWHNMFGTDSASYELNKYEERTTKRGKDAPAQGPSRGAGKRPEPVFLNAANAWVHPLSLQLMLEFARELFLSGARTELEALLVDYDAALAGTPNDSFSAGHAALWTAAHAEVAAMLQRLRAHLDYFGNRAGYTPLLSLQSSIRLYAEETSRSLRTLLLVRWIDAKERSAEEAQAALADVIREMNADAQKAADQVVRAEAKISDATKQIETLEQQLDGLSNKLEILRNTLLTKAQNDLQQQAQIKFMIRMAAAVCQVIPVGQPVLGTIGSLAGAASEFVGDDGSKAPDTVSKIGDVLTKANKAAEKAKEAKEKAAKEKAKDPDSDAEKAGKSADAWAKVGKGLGPAMSQVSEGIKALQVPASEVEAELQRLESESPEWKELTKEIRELNERKATLFEDLAAGYELLGEGYARIATNASGTFAMKQERSRQLGRLDPAATGYVRQLGQRSRLTLQKYLYLMVKSYETTVFKPIAVDWNLSGITDKVVNLVQPDEGFTAASLDAHAKVLEPLFQQNIDAVRNALLSDFSFGESTITLQFGLSASQTPELLKRFNKTGAITLDPVACGLVLPDQQLARLSSIVLKKLEFDAAGPALPETHNVIVSVQPSNTGAMRKGEQFYAVYSDEPMKWIWTRVASGEVKPGVPSNMAEDMLDLVLGTGSGKIRQKVALPPVWSELNVKVLFSPELPASRRPIITQLYFEFGVDASAAPAQQRVLNVQSLGVTGGAVIDCSSDLARRSAGFESMIRVFTKGARVRMSVPEHAGGAAFDCWDVIGRSIEQTDIRESNVEFTIDDHVLAHCSWTGAHAEEETVVLAQELAPEDVAAIAAEHTDANVRSALTAALSTVAAPQDLPIRVAPRSDATIVGIAPDLNALDVVETAPDGWLLVNHRGVVGWTRTLIALEQPVVTLPATRSTD